jgi:Transposase DDE domain
LNLVKGSLQRELDDFFQVLRNADVAERAVTKSAFCAARQKLKPSAFIDLNQDLVRRWYRDAPVRRWHGLDLRAIDGSTLRLPDTPDAIAAFGQMFPAHSAPATLARISQIYDPLNGLILDALIAPYQRDERNLLVEHLAALEAGCLLLLDSGYPAFWLFAALPARKIAWCARVALDTWSVVRNFLAAGQDDAVVTLEPHTEALADCRARGLSMLPIRVRLIRVLLPTGEVEVLMTSLLACDDYPAETFAGLYHLRWTQEECYKCFKCRVEVENWSGKSALTIDQDFHAKVLALNLTAVLARAAQNVVDDRCRDDSHPKQVNMTHALCAMKGALIRLLTRSDPLELLRALVTAVARTVEPIRPGRSSPRRKGPRLHGYHMAYKPCT